MNKVYIIVPLIALAVFGGFYMNFSKGYAAKIEAVQAKEAEENLLYRDMQTDIVQQLMRRLAAVKSI